MIELYTWPTPNGHKIHIMLEECALPYRAIAVDIGAGEQFNSEFLAISPNNKIPAIVDPDGPDGRPISLFESGAILVYLPGKTGRFLPETTRGKYEALSINLGSADVALVHALACVPRNQDPSVFKTLDDHNPQPFPLQLLVRVNRSHGLSMGADC